MAKAGAGPLLSPGTIPMDSYFILFPFAVPRSCHITPISTTVLTAEEMAYFALMLARHRFRSTRVSFEDLEVNKKQPACQDSLLDMARGTPTVVKTMEPSIHIYIYNYIDFRQSFTPKIMCLSTFYSSSGTLM